MLLAGPKGRKYTATRCTFACATRSSKPARGCRVPVGRKSPVKSRVNAWWPVVAWTLVILLLTAVRLPEWKGAAGTQADKIVHFGLYFGLGLTLGRAARLSRLRGILALSAPLAAGIGFAAVDELMQGWVPTRVPQMSDWLADVAGLLAAYALYLARWRHRWKTEARAG